MTNTINGRTPEEIKKGLEYYAETDLAKKLNACKQGLKYWYAEDVAADALAYIQQLERERDAAVEALCKIDEILIKHNWTGTHGCMNEVRKTITDSLIDIICSR